MKKEKYKVSCLLPGANTGAHTSRNHFNLQNIQVPLCSAGVTIGFLVHEKLYPDLKSYFSFIALHIFSSL